MLNGHVVENDTPITFTIAHDRLWFQCALTTKVGMKDECIPHPEPPLMLHPAATPVGKPRCPLWQLQFPLLRHLMSTIHPHMLWRQLFSRTLSPTGSNVQTCCCWSWESSTYLATRIFVLYDVLLHIRRTDMEALLVVVVHMQIVSVPRNRGMGVDMGLGHSHSHSEAHAVGSVHVQHSCPSAQGYKTPMSLTMWVACNIAFTAIPKYNLPTHTRHKQCIAEIPLQYRD